MKLYIFSKQFRQILKKADYDSYMSLGHYPNSESPITLWLIDHNGNIKTNVIEDENTIHASIYSDHALNVARAFGRFDPKTKELTATYAKKPSESEKIWIAKILKEKFGDAKIYWFD